jgi:hypothetical protein
MSFSIDHNLEGQAVILYGNIAKQGWLTLLPIRFVTFEELGIPVSSDDMPPARYANALSGDALKKTR